MYDRLVRTCHILEAERRHEIKPETGRWGQAGSAAGTAVRHIPIPFAPLIGSLLSKAIETHGEQARQKFSDLVIDYLYDPATHSANIRLLQNVAFTIARDYSRQLEQLTEASLGPAINYVVSAILGEAALAQKSSPGASLSEKERILSYSVRACGKVKIDKVTLRQVGTPPQKWTTHGMFKKSGIEIGDTGERYIMVEARRTLTGVFSSEKKRHEKYGFHYGSYQEAEESGYQKLVRRDLRFFSALAVAAGVVPGVDVDGAGVAEREERITDVAEDASSAGRSADLGVSL